MDLSQSQEQSSVTIHLVRPKVRKRHVHRVKPDLAPSLHPTKSDIAWAAGIYEGEGWVGGGTQISVGQKDPWLPRRMRELFGGSIRQKTGPGECQMHYWMLSGPRARGFAFTIFSFLSPRRRARIKASILDYKHYPHPPAAIAA
jgi:hypothetical protein